MACASHELPPKVGDAMDDAQKWAVACTHAALTDYGWPERTIDTERTAVILGNAMAGEKHYQTALRIAFPEVARELAAEVTTAEQAVARFGTDAETTRLFAHHHPDYRKAALAAADRRTA